MIFVSQHISTMLITTPAGKEIALSAKASEDPEIKMFTDEIESADDGLTNDGHLIVKSTKSRTYIKATFGFNPDDVPVLKSIIDFGVKGLESAASAVMTDSSIYSNEIILTDPIINKGDGTIELSFESAKDWIISN